MESKAERIDTNVDQKELRQYEKRCIQEEPPACQAACPLHVDARAFVNCMHREDWDEAWRVLFKTMPFPGILGRVCDAPCQKHCKRGQVDDPIEIGALERNCVSHPSPTFKLPPIMAKDKRIAVFGSGLGGLTAVWDLARKGYAVTLWVSETSVSRRLIKQYPKYLTPKIIESETAVLNRLDVNIQTGVDLPSPNRIRQYLQTFDGVYIALDAADGGETENVRGDGSVSENQTTAMEGVFAGGLSANSAQSPAWQAAEGRWAATSIDRYIQNVSMTAGRDKERPYPTKLYTNIQGVPEEPAVRASELQQGYTDGEAAQEARRCLQCECLECVKVCPYLEHFNAYPKKYAREIYNNASIVMGARQANKLINSCSLCGLCEQVCPENFAMQDLCLAARQDMVRRDKMPPSAHEFALMDMEFSQSDAFALACHQPGADASTHLFFPGCQLCASCPDTVFKTYQYLCSAMHDGLGLMLGCCSAPAYWAGREELFQKGLQAWKQNWSHLGKPEVIPACSTCFQIFRDHLPEVTVTPLWNVLDQIGLPEREVFLAKQPLAIHDPCTTRSEPGVHRAVRRLLQQGGLTVEELPLSKEYTECCGFGGLMQNANPQIARTTLQRRAELSATDYITYCGMCRDNLASTGKRIVHILDILFPDSREKDPAARKRPGWSQRRENRIRLKKRVNQVLGIKQSADKQPHERIHIRMKPHVRENLEQRRILDEDIQKVIMHAQNGGQTFIHKKTGVYKASFKNHNVTFWVEYAPAENGFEVHKAYCHRMEVVQA